MSVEYDRLLLFIAMGDMRALEHLYTALYPNAYSLALAVTKDPASAEDIAQETFVRVFTFAKKYREQGYARAWVLRITRNLALNALRSAKTVSVEETAELSAADDAFARAEAGDLARELLMRLKPGQRQVVVLRSKGYTHREIARVMATNEATVRWQYGAALKKLKAAAEHFAALGEG